MNNETDVGEVDRYYVPAAMTTVFSLSPVKLIKLTSDWLGKYKERCWFL